MTPYYQHGGITIYHGDCREVSIDRVDAIVTDPPYGETSLEWDKQVRGWMDAAASISSSLWCFGSLEFFMEMARTGESSRWTRSQELVWEKHNGSGFHADRFKRVHELIVHFYRGPWSGIYHQPVFTRDAVSRAVRREIRPAHMGNIAAHAFVSFDGGPRMMRSVIYARSCHGMADHPTQKPIEIIVPILEYSVPVGGTVVDMFCGSGSTLVAAKSLGLHGVGIEIEERSCEIAARRLSQEVIEFTPVC